MFRLFHAPEGDRVVIVSRDSDGAWFRLHPFSIDALFQADDPCEWIGQRLQGAGSEPIEYPGATTLAGTAWLPPVENQEVWAAGVTYLRSRSARMEESEESGGDFFYDLVYEAERPELFFKATARRVRGHRAPVRVRSDSSWDVPEPELTLAIDARGRVFGFAVGNDMSSRSIEGENPLYLPQAKVYDGSCAIGPCLVVRPDPLPVETPIELEIRRGEEVAFSGSTDLSQLKRGTDELAGWLFKENTFPAGAFLMTGTGVVPGSDFSLASGDEIRIAIAGVGELTNTVA